jgi:hypothetical protein
MCISMVTYPKNCQHPTIQSVRVCRFPASCSERVQRVNSARPRDLCRNCEGARAAHLETRAREQEVWWKKGDRVNLKPEEGPFVDVKL